MCMGKDRHPSSHAPSDHPPNNHIRQPPPAGNPPRRVNQTVGANQAAVRDPDADIPRNINRVSQMT